MQAGRRGSAALSLRAPPGAAARTLLRGAGAGLAARLLPDPDRQPGVGVAADRQPRATGYIFDWNWSVYADASREYHEQFIRSIGTPATATVLVLHHRVPAGLLHRLQGGRCKNLMLLLIILPFFTSYLVRTVAWQTILSDDGWVVTRCSDVGLLADDGRLLATRTAVIAGITYNFLPFMALPLYVSLERIDRRLIEAATDLYASRGDGVPQGHAAAGAARASSPARC